MATLKIDQFSGINSTLASLQLKPGELESSQNLRARPYGNYSRRKGIEPVSIQTDPVLGIFELELDNVTIPVVQTGGNLQFFPPLGSPSIPDVDPYPSDDPLDPGGDRIFLFDIEQAMRAINDRRVTAGHAAYSWPNIRFDVHGLRINTAVSAYPATGTYGPDMAYDDIYNANPLGTKAASLVNIIILAYQDTVGFNDWIKLIAGQSSVTYYQASDGPSAGTATATRYKSVFTALKAAIRNLAYIQAPGQQTSVESKSGTAHDSSGIVCPGFTLSPTTVSISGWGAGFFSLTSDCSTYFDGSSCICVGNAYLNEDLSSVLPCEAVTGALDANGGCFLNAFTANPFHYTIDGIPGGAQFDINPSPNGLVWTMVVVWYYDTYAFNGGCNVDDGFSINVWTGTMTTAVAGDARGTYTRTAGCSTRGTVVIV